MAAAPKPKRNNDDRAEKTSKTVDKWERKEAQRGVGPGGGAGRRVHEGRRENA